MKTLVTGGGGFLGSHLVERLRGEGHEVAAPRRSEHDLTREDDAVRLFRDTEPELVYHLDVSKAEQLFGFRARTALRDGLERTVAWYRASAPAYAAG